MNSKLLFIFIAALQLMSLQSNAQQAKEVLLAGEKKIPVYDFANLEQVIQPTDDSIFIINFWATWCIPCVQELPYFEELLEKYKSEKLRIKLVSLDFRKQVDRGLIPFVIKKDLQAEVLLLDDKDANSWIDKVDPSWSGALPATLILNKNRRLFFEKSFNFEELENEFLNIQKK